MVQYLLTLDEFNENIINVKEGVCVVDFTATWCGPCQRVAPEFEALADEMKTVKFFKVDVDQNEQAAQQQNISCMPTFQIFNNGELVETVSGANIANVKMALQKLGTNQESV